jgi:hypothetical protein
VIGLEVLARLAEARNDVGVRNAVEYPVVDLITKVPGQAGDIAVATIAVGEPGGGGFSGLWSRAGLGTGWKFQDLRFGMHRL